MRLRRPLAIALLSPALFATGAAAQADWVYFGQDQGASKYSTLDQIHAGNVQNLERAWTFHTGNDSGFFEATPLVVGGVLYFSSQDAVFALDPVTGEEKWRFQTEGRVTRRGVSYWPGDGAARPRILTAFGNRLVALDVETGQPIPGFGDGGFVDMGTGMNSPPAIYRNLIITPQNEPVIRAWDARTGALAWTFHLIAQPGDPAHATWENDAWRDIGGTNVWGYLSVDPERGIVYIPNSIAGSDYTGVSRPGDNLYGTSLVAVDADDGTLVWYQQLVHHDIWDFDLGAAPTLFEAQLADGRRIPAVAQISKMGMMYIFDRTNGDPFFGLEERPVPQSDVPGEKTSPTQPFTVKPEPLARISMSEAELPTGITPELTAHCRRLWDQYDLQDSGPYTPWGYNRDVVVFPGAIGGGNWNGITYNAGLGLLITNVMNAGQWGHIEGEGDRFRKVTPEGRRFWEPESRYSCVEPPWGELIAVSANTGDIVWRVPLGIFEELEARGIRTGTPSLGGAISTAGNLVFIGATIDGRFRAFDARDGRELWSEVIDAPAHSIPSTYMGRDGRQYVVVAAGGGGFLNSPTADALIAFRLP
jgi:quinoprotein glucose dehydrogenase